MWGHGGGDSVDRLPGSLGAPVVTRTSGRGLPDMSELTLAEAAALPIEDETMEPDDIPTAREVGDLAALLTIKVVQSLSETTEQAEARLEDIATELASWASRMHDARMRSLVLIVSDVLMGTEEGSEPPVRGPGPQG